MPKDIQVEVGDVVNFVVAGLHIIRVYEPGVFAGAIRNQIPDECEVNPVPSASDAPQCYFGDVEGGLVPEKGSVSRNLPLLPHFNDRMLAWVEVVPRGRLSQQ